MKRAYTRRIQGETVCEIELTDVVDGLAFVTRLWTHPSWRSKGIATELGRRVCADADREGVELSAHTRHIPDVAGNGMSTEELQQWYRQCFDASPPDPASGCQRREPRP